MSTSDKESVMQSLWRKPRRRLTRKEKGKKKMPRYGTNAGTSYRNESNGAMSKDEPPKLSSELAKRALKTGNERLCQSSHHKNLVTRYGYSEYMYVYMTKVVEIRELESYAKAAQDAKWRIAMGEEMHALVENVTWDLLDAPKGVKLIGCRWVYKVKYNANGSIRATHNNTASTMTKPSNQW